MSSAVYGVFKGKALQGESIKNKVIGLIMLVILTLLPILWVLYGSW
jgi:heme/copper-type cytochrome/quinol oxidase subunit 4